jgi:hypothetical protein
VGVAVKVLVRVCVKVKVRDGVKVGVLLLVGVKVNVKVGVDVVVEVLLGVEVGVLVRLGVKVRVWVEVAVGVLLGVEVGVLVRLDVEVRVWVEVAVGVLVCVEVGVLVRLGVKVGVWVGVAVEVLVGDNEGVTEAVGTVKLVALVAVPPGLITLIGPVVALAGTVALMDVADKMVKLALEPLNRTTLTWVKLYPLMVTLVPGTPLVGKKPVITGGIALTAAAASSIPLPQSAVVQVLPEGNGLALLCRICNTWEGVSSGLSENMSETTPVTCGVAMLVPW